MTTEDGAVQGQQEELEEDESLPLVLTPRDIGVLKLIHEHQYSPNNLIRDAFWKGRSVSSNSCYRRIERLVKSGFLKRDYSKWLSMVVYLLAAKGFKELQSRGLDSGLELYEKTEDFDRYSEHDLNVLSLRVLFAELGLNEWRSERLLVKDKLSKLPDGVLNVRGFKIAIEMDNSRKDQSRYRDIFSYYSENTNYALAFMVMNADLKNWLFGMKYDVKRIWFTNYSRLFKLREQTLFENKSGSFHLSRIL